MYKSIILLNLLLLLLYYGLNYTDSISIITTGFSDSGSN